MPGIRGRDARFISLLWAVLCLLCAIGAVGYVDLSTLQPEEMAIMQYDSRPMRDYWLAAARWNKNYCNRHGHVFIYYASKEGCHYGSEELATPWCKVKAMLSALEEFPSVRFFVYMDSDAVIDQQFHATSLAQMAGTMQQKLNWDPDKRPVVFNQDGPCWWCRLVKRVGYNMCLNAGTVAWYRHPLSEQVLRQWWDAAMDPYETNPIKRRFRTKWPWEQDRQMAVYNRSSQLIQVASQPEREKMIPRAGLSQEVGWCLSHLPGSGCFISHFCENSNSKQRMRRVYGGGGADQAQEPAAGFDVNYLKFP